MYFKILKIIFSWVLMWFRFLILLGGGSNCFNGMGLRGGEFMSMVFRKEKVYFMVVV